MKLGTTKKTAILALTGLMIVGAFAAPANAYDGGTTQQWDGTPYIVANAGVLGDVGFICLVGDTDLNGNYGASAGPAGSPVGVNILVQSLPTIPTDRICVGGAGGEFGSAGPGTWNVYGQDYLINGCEDTRLEGLLGPGGVACGLYPGVDGVVGNMGAALTARVGVTAIYGNVPPNTTNCGAPATPTFCFTDDDYEVFRNSLIMGVCGQASTDFVASEVDETGARAALIASGENTANVAASPTSVEANAEIFAVGPLFYPGVCGGATFAPVIGAYNTAVGLINTVTCDPDDIGPLPVVGTIPGIGLVCFFNYPGEPEDCSPSSAFPTGTPFPLIAGEIAWDFTTNTGVTCNHRNDDWQYFGGDGALIFIEEGTTIAGVLTTVDGVLTTVDTTVSGLVSLCVALGASSPCPGATTILTV